MISLNPQLIFQHSTPRVIDNHITVNTAAEMTGYNIQYLRRLLRSVKLEGSKIGQIWLIEMQSLETYLQTIKTTSNRCCRPRYFIAAVSVNFFL